MSRFCQYWLQLEEMRKNEDPRLSFSTPEFKEAQRIFTGGLKVIRMTNRRQHVVFAPSYACPAACTWHTLEACSKCTPGNANIFLQGNFNKPVEWGLIKDHAWSTPQLRKLETPVSPLQSLVRQKSVCSCNAMAADIMLCPTQVDVDGKPWPLDAAGKPVL